MKILVYPKDANPYQSLLYTAMKKDNPKIKIRYIYNFPLLGSLPLLIIAPFMRILGFKLIHIHWPSFGMRLPSKINQAASYYIFLFTLKWLVLLRYRTVWTVHNVLPHESKTTNDLLCMQKLSFIADAKIVHSKLSLHQMDELGLSTNNTFVIPHGNYIGVYNDEVSRRHARAQLNHKEDEFVILFFGLIRPYKGLEALLDIIEANETYEQTRLVVAGMCSDASLRNRLIKLRDESKINYFDGRVPDENVAMLFKACDVVCLPFKTITTSGSALLALSFGKPLIAPLLGTLTDLPRDVGFFYDPNDPNGLENSIEIASSRTEDVSKISNNAYKYAKTLDWGTIGLQTNNLFLKVLGQKR